jgi:hypothetical protein
MRIVRFLLSFHPDRDPPPSPSKRRAPPQPEHEKDWAIGDRARCIIVPGGRWITVGEGEPASGPGRGAILRVAHLYGDELSVWLCFREFPHVSYPAGHFRKLRPCSTDFREQMRATVGKGGPATKAPTRLPAPKAIPELVP